MNKLIIHFIDRNETGGMLNSEPHTSILYSYLYHILMAEKVRVVCGCAAIHFVGLDLRTKTQLTLLGGKIK